jgi:dTDP-4-amino-4,6-dideoxygalactose transaminase
MEQVLVPFYDLKALHDSIGDDLQRAVRRVLDSGQFVHGDECSAFELEFAQYCSTTHCIGVGNGLDALSLILRAIGVTAGDKVVVPANTFIATWLAVSNLGATVVPVELSAVPSQDELSVLAHALDDSVKAVIVVHLYGIPVDVTGIREILAGSSIHLIEDAAQAHGATIHGETTGSIGDAAAFSFYPGKNLGALGDGGAVTTSSDQLAAAVRRLANYGSTAKYVHAVRGVNSRLDELQAAVLRVKLPHLDGWNEVRRKIASRYADGLDGLALRLPVPPPDSEPVWHLYAIGVEDRSRFMSFMQERGVQLSIHYPTACHHQEAYRQAFAPDQFPNTIEICRTTVSLPMGPMLSEQQQSLVIDCIREWFGTN